MIEASNCRHIFTPQHQKLYHDNSEFAQSPQAVFLNDTIRVYFTSRYRDDKASYISYPSYFECDTSFKVLNVASHEIIRLGDLGTYYEHGIFPFSPFVDENNFYAFISGWSRRVSVPVETAIGLAISSDFGHNFSTSPGPVLSATQQSPFLVVDGYVKKFNGIYYMWYIHGTEWIQTDVSDKIERVYKITYATSKDLVTWFPSFSNIIEDKLGVYECQALPSVVFYEGSYLMFFCYRTHIDFRKNSANSYQIACAQSKDLLNWHRLGDVCFDASDKSISRSYPSPLVINNQLFIFYNGNDFGKFGIKVAKIKSLL